MIQFKRGKTSEWFEKSLTMEPLAAGQPGYDSVKNKLKIGDGKHSWGELPYTGGCTPEEILSPESEARERFTLFDRLIAGFKKLFNINTSNDKIAIITYGDESPTEDTVGQLYLQEYASEPEADYVVGYGTSGIWEYRKWRSGAAECWCSFDLETSLNTQNGDVMVFYNDSPMDRKNYPIEFKDGLNDKKPVEVATVSSDSSSETVTEGCWLATCSKNTYDQTAQYRIANCQPTSSTVFTISIHVRGRYKQ